MRKNNFFDVMKQSFQLSCLYKNQTIKNYTYENKTFISNFISLCRKFFLHPNQRK